MMKRTNNFLLNVTFKGPAIMIAIATALFLGSCSNTEVTDPEGTNASSVENITEVAPTPTETVAAESEPAIGNPDKETPDKKQSTKVVPTTVNPTTETETAQQPAEQSTSTAIASTPNTPRLLSPEELEKFGQSLPVPGRELIAAHSFWIDLHNLGEVALVASEAVNDPTQARNNLSLDLISANGEVVQTLPTNEDTDAWVLWEMEAITFEELDFEGPSPDVMTLATYITGVGPTGSQPFPVITVYFNQQGTHFTTDQSLNRLLTERDINTTAEAIDIMRNELMYLP